MRNVFLFFTVFLLCMASALRAQDTTIVQIGAGIDTCEYLPTYIFSNYSLSEQIYTATEIGQSGTIYSIAFYNVTHNVTRNLDVYLAHTSKTTFDNGTDWAAVADSNLVFSGTVTFMQNQWGKVEFSTPFVYNGTDNLLVVVNDQTGNWLMDRYFRVFNAPNQALYDDDDLTNFDPTLSIGYDGSISSVKNQIQLSFAQASCPTPSMFTVSNIESTSATLSWTENGDATAWDIHLHSLEDSTFTVYTNPYTLTNLTPGMHYSVMMRANCGDSSSDWVTEEFFTPICSSPSDVYASNIGPTSALLNWTADGSASSWEISLNGDGTNTITVHTNPYELTGLTPDSFYDVAVRTICGDSNNVSHWTNTSFTTTTDYQIQSTANWYGYAINSLLEDGNLAHYDWEKEFISFSMQNLSTVNAASDLNSSIPYTYAATYANGYVWCITYDNGHLCRASIDDNTKTISNFEIIVPDFEIGEILRSMSYNPVDGRIYYITSEPVLKSFHPSNPEDVSLIGFLDFKPITFAINSSGEAYVIQANNTGDLYRLYLDDASVTLIGSTDIPVDHEQSMAFDMYTGELFWAQYHNRINNHIYLVDPATAATKHLGRIGEGGGRITGLFMVDTIHNVGIRSLSDNSFLLYPNPAKEVVNVQWTMNNEQWGVEVIEVLDLYGRVVRTVDIGENNDSPLQTRRINVSGLAPGMYFVRVTTDTGQITKPFIKN